MDSHGVVERYFLSVQFYLESMQKLTVNIRARQQTERKVLTLDKQPNFPFYNLPKLEISASRNANTNSLPLCHNRKQYILCTIGLMNVLTLF